MSKHNKFFVALLTPIFAWAVQAGFMPEPMASPEFVASVATVLAGLVWLIPNRRNSP